jgi:hypothetical protein
MRGTAAEHKFQFSDSRRKSNAQTRFAIPFSARPLNCWASFFLPLRLKPTAIETISALRSNDLRVPVLTIKPEKTRKSFAGKEKLI